MPGTMPAAARAANSKHESVVTHPHAETTKLLRQVLEIAGPKRVSAATGFALGTVYAWARDPMDLDPDGTGQSNPLDRLEQIAEALATRGEPGRTVLIQLDGWWQRLMDRLLGQRAEQLTHSALLGLACEATREASDVGVALADGADRDRVRREIAEAREALDRLERSVGADEAAPTLRRVS